MATGGPSSKLKMFDITYDSTSGKGAAAESSSAHWSDAIKSQIKLPAAPRPFADPTLNYYLAPGDKLVTCPYYGHRVLEARFTIHLTKCVAQYKKAQFRNHQLPNFVICEYNWQHHVKESDYAKHLNLCTDALNRKSLDEENERMEKIKPSVRRTVSAKPIEKESKLDEVDEDNLSVDMEQLEPSFRVGTTISDIQEGSFFDASASVVNSGITSPNLDTSDKDTTISTRSAVTENEDWDTECKPGQREPFQMNCLIGKYHIYYIPPGMTKKERKDYRRMAAALPQKPTKIDKKGVKGENFHADLFPELPPTKTSSLKRPAVTAAAVAHGLKQREFDQFMKTEKIEGGVTVELFPGKHDYDCDKRF